MPLILKAPVTVEDLTNYLTATTSVSHDICSLVAACFFYEDEDGEPLFSSARGSAVAEAVRAAEVALMQVEK